MSLLVALAEEGGTNILEQELVWVGLLTVAALVAIIVRRVRLPYTVALVIVGLILTLVPSPFEEVAISSDLILALLVPPLLFEATLHVSWRRLRSDLVPILLLAGIGSLLGTLLIGGGIAALTPIPLAAALAFGALISATDPVAVIAFFRSLGVSKRLAILVEGESMFNDGVAVVLFTLAISVASDAQSTLSLTDGVLTFLRVAFGGLLVGIFLGGIVSWGILRNIDDHLIETMVTVALAFGSYVVAEEFGLLVGRPELHLSGILAVVSAGIIVGNVGSNNTSPTTKVALDNFWELTAYVVNSLVFLLIGLEINVTEFLPRLGLIFLALILTLVSRLIVVYGLTWLSNRLVRRRPVPLPFQHVMYWGGLRGAISLALALTLTASVGGALARELQLMTFGVVLFTLIVQGLSIEALIRRLGLSQRPEPEVERQRRQAMVYARRAGKRELDRLHDEGILSDNAWRALTSVYGSMIGESQRTLREHLQEHPELELDMIIQARADALRAERSAISDAARRGLISEDILHHLVRETDDRSEALEIARGMRRSEIFPDGTAPLHVDHPVPAQLDCIVVAIRGGEGSQVVKDRAVALARAAGARLILLYVVDTSTVEAQLDDHMEAAVREELRWLGASMLNIARERAAQLGISAEVEIREGRVKEEIAAFLEEEKADLLLLGAPRGTSVSVFGDDAVEQFALGVEKSTGVAVEIVRPEG